MSYYCQIRHLLLDYFCPLHLSAGKQIGCLCVDDMSGVASCQQFLKNHRQGTKHGPCPTLFSSNDSFLIEGNSKQVLSCKMEFAWLHNKGCWENINLPIISSAVTVISGHSLADLDALSCRISLSPIKHDYISYQQVSGFVISMGKIYPKQWLQPVSSYNTLDDL